MRNVTSLVLALILLCALVFLNTRTASAGDAWSVKASFIEACSCELFCKCYFNTSPDKDFCKMDNAVRINRGHVGKVKLDGVKFWMSGDLGGDFTKGFKTGILTFEPSASQEQVDAIMSIVPKIYPGQWESVSADPVRKAITWEKKGHDGYARLGDGDGEVTLTGVVGSDGKTLVKIENLKYWAAQKNGGFILAKSKHHYKGNGLDYAFDDANGFFIDIEASGS